MATPHLDPVSKLALGWVTPRIVREGGAYSLKDVKLSHEVLVLPRLPGDTADEYIILESRQDAPDNERYDHGISPFVYEFDNSGGVAVWHVIEGFAASGIKPNCTSNALWQKQTGVDSARRGIRVIRPSVSYSQYHGLWSDEYYDLDGDGLVCPNEGPAHNVLRWSDGEVGYRLLDFSVPGPVMSFDVVMP